MKKIKILIFVLPVIYSVFLLTSCDLLFGKKTEPTYNAKVLWKIEIQKPGMSSYQDILLINEKLYILTEKSIPGEKLLKDLYLTVINKNTHEVNNVYIERKTGVFIMKEIEVNGESCLVLFHNSDGDIVIYNTNYNTIKASIQLNITSLSKDERRAIFPQDTLCFHENKIIWYSMYYHAFVFLDMGNIDFSKPANEKQILLPQILLKTDVASETRPVIKNDILYYILGFGKHGYIGAFNISSKVKSWEIKAGVPGKSNNGLLFFDDLLIFVGGFGFISMKHETGEILHLIESNDNMQIQSSGSPMCKHDGLLYFTTGIVVSTKFGQPSDSPPAIICFDPKNASFIWGDMPQNGPTLNQKPLAYNNKIYLTNGIHGLRMYDAKNGKLLGVDPDIHCLYSNNLVYDNTMCFLCKDDGKDYFVAIEAE